MRAGRSILAVAAVTAAAAAAVTAEAQMGPPGKTADCELPSSMSMSYEAGAENAKKGTERVDAARACFDRDGAIRIPSYTIPQSALASPEMRAGTVGELVKSLRPPLRSIEEIRKRLDDDITLMIDKARKIYPVDIKPETIAGVYTESFTPKGGVRTENRDKVLIELHGGGFSVGARTAGRTESIPIASLTGYRVVAVDYRQAPEFRYPAATEDVAAVYRELLKQYKPENIGVYGCSAGGILTAQFVAWAQVHGLPRPGAITIACSGAGMIRSGDSHYWAPPLNGLAPPNDAPDASAQTRLGYFEGADLNDPLVSPVRFPTVLAKFPPTLIINGTRDQALSAAVYSHSELVKAGVEADLHVWEGMGHGYHLIVPDAPESKEANRVIANFFMKHLGENSRAAK